MQLQVLQMDGPATEALNAIIAYGPLYIKRKEKRPKGRATVLKLTEEYPGAAGKRTR